MAKNFDPNDFFDDIFVKDVVEQFPQLKDFDYSIESLNEQLTKVNYEIMSPEYEDKKFSNIENYYDLLVDKIV